MKEMAKTVPRTIKGAVPDEPELGLTEQKSVTIRLVSQDTDAPCDFWVGLSSAGPVGPFQFLQIPSVTEVFTKAASEGIKESGPVMLSDTDRTPPRYIYLLPVPNSEFRAKTKWIADLRSTVCCWSPEAIGFYLAPELLGVDGAQDLLLQILRELMVSAPTKQYFLLLGSYGVNCILNTALKLKFELESDAVNLFVFH